MLNNHFDTIFLARAIYRVLVTTESCAEMSDMKTKGALVMRQQDWGNSDHRWKKGNRYTAGDDLISGEEQS